MSVVYTQLLQIYLRKMIIIEYSFPADFELMFNWNVDLISFSEYNPTFFLDSTSEGRKVGWGIAVW